MSTNRDFDRIAGAWLAEGPSELADRVLDAALDEVHLTNQRRRWATPWRASLMTLRLGAAALIAIIAVAGILAFNMLGSGIGSVPTPSATTSATQHSSSPSITPTAASPAVSTVLDTRTIATRFPLAMKITLPVGWKNRDEGIVGALAIVHTGYPEGPESKWWGPDFFLVEDAQIHDPADVVSDVPATADRSQFVAWPADFFAYITALPDVTVVSGPEPITVGGVLGTQVVVMTPPMHPLVWLKGDFTWMGGGPTGVDPALERRFVILVTGGHTLFVQLAADQAAFEAHDAEFRAILESVTFD
jgi:hypothetical protein